MTPSPVPSPVPLPARRAGRTPTQLMLRTLFRRRVVLAAAVVLAVMLLVALFAPWLAPQDPSRLDVLNRLQGPSLQHPFGTDDFGRDVLSRAIMGARSSLTVAGLIVLVSGLLGSLIGLLAGASRRLDAPLMRLVDALMAFPDILLATALMAALGPSTSNVVLALGIVYAPRVARIVRASTLVVREQPYVEAALALGASEGRIAGRHIFPNITSPLIVQATFVFSTAVLTEAALSFLGIGVPPTVPTWGNMIAGAQQYFQQADWLMVFPGLCIVLTVLSLQMLGDGLRDALDPTIQKEA